MIMKEIDFNSELNSLIQYYQSLEENQEKLGVDMEEITKDIISKKESGEPLKVGDFTDLEQASFKVNLYNQDMLRCASVVRELYRIALNSGSKIDLSDAHDRILKDLINGPNFGFMFYADNHGLHFKDEEFESNIKNICSSRIDPATLEDRYIDLKAQYEAFLKIRNNNIGGDNGSQETDSK